MRRRKKKQPQANKLINLIVCSILIILIIFFLIKLTQDIWDYVLIEKEIRELDTEIAQLEYELEKLSNAEYKAKLIREEFYLSSENELLFILE